MEFVIGVILGVILTGLGSIFIVNFQNNLSNQNEKKEQSAELLFLYEELDMILKDVLTQSTWSKNRHVDVGYMSNFCGQNFKKFSGYTDFLKALFYINHIYFAYNKYHTIGANIDRMWDIKYKDHMTHENLVGSTQLLMEEIEKIIKSKDIIFYNSFFIDSKSFHHQIRGSHPPLEIKKLKVL
jgi:hypothetical protein